jgi:O-antigen/teichoic acid export membrane protein
LSSSQDQTDTPARGAYHLFVGNFTFTVIVALSSFVIARLLGPAGYGLYSLALVLPTYLYTILQLGITSSATYFAAKYRSEGNIERAHEFIYSVTLFQLIISLVAVAITMPLSSTLALKLINRPELGAIIPIAVITVLGHVTYYTSTAGLQGLSKMNRSAGLQVLLAVIRLVSSAGLILLGFGVLGAVIGNLLGFVISGGLGLAIIIMMHGKLVPRRIFGDAKMALTYGAPIYVASLIGGLVPPFQSTLLANFENNTVIGWYNGATNLSTLVTVFTYPISTVLFPLFTSYSNDKSRLLEVYRIAARYSTMIIVPITSFVFSLATVLAPAALGHFYPGTGPYLRVIVVVYLLAGLGFIAQSALLNSMRRRREYMLTSLLGSGITIIFSAAFIRNLGVYSVLLGSLIGQVSSNLILWVLVGKILDGNIQLRTLWKIYLASAISATLVYPVAYIPLHPLILAVLGLVLYMALLIPLFVYTKAISTEDVMRLDSYFKSIKLMHLFFRVARWYYELFAGKVIIANNS